MIISQRFKAGFSLLESIVSMCIVAVALLGMYSTLYTTGMWKQINNETQKATLAMRQKMEEVLTDDWNNVVKRDGERFVVPGLPLIQGSHNKEHYDDDDDDDQAQLTSETHGVIKVDTKNAKQGILIISITISWKSVQQNRSVTTSTFMKK